RDRNRDRRVAVPERAVDRRGDQAGQRDQQRHGVEVHAAARSRYCANAEILAAYRPSILLDLIDYRSVVSVIADPDFYEIPCLPRIIVTPRYFVITRSMSLLARLWREASLAAEVEGFCERVGTSILDDVDGDSLVVRTFDGEHGHLATAAFVRRGALGV